MSKKKRPIVEQHKEAPADAPVRQKPVVDIDYFRAVWNRSETLREAAETLGLAASTCASYADRLRQAGHKMKEFARGRPRLLKM